MGGACCAGWGHRVLAHYGVNDMTYNHFSLRVPGEPGHFLVKPTDCPFMTMAFDSTDLARKDLVAAVHPADYTVRPQILERSANPDYYTLIAEFEALTGIGGLLNTSLNLHGEPVVCSPDDAFHTFEHSELDAIVFDDFLITRQR